jgi:diguanylate cyclase (GGDEF)-like protein
MKKTPQVSLSKIEQALYKDLVRTFRSFELQTVVEELFSSLQRHFLVDYGTIILLSQRGQFVERVFRMGIPGEKHQAERFGMTKLDIEKLVRDMIPRYHVFPDSEPEKPTPLIEGKPIGVLACFPLQLIYDYEAAMLLAVSQEHMDKLALDHNGFLFLSNFATDISFALKNALAVKRLNDLITKDDLTMSYNRRFFEDYLSEEIDRARRYNSPLSLIFLDLDGLREVNSQFGHAMGSRTLQEAAARIMNAVRSIDKVIRYGGDEFCVVLPETDAKGAIEVAERVRLKVASTPFLLEETGGIEMTASFGVASYPVHAITKEELVKKADEAMFRIKAQSKNDIQVAKPLKNYP